MPRGPLTWFNDYAARPPSRLVQAFAILLGVALTIAVWDRRGPMAGIVALVMYGVGFTVVSLRHRETLAWSRRHPMLDSLLVVPASFLAVAYLSDLALVVCAAIGVGAWILLLPLFLRRRKRLA